MEKDTNIFLVGPMGSGKTSIGKLLAKSLGLTFYDSDQEIERRTGANIPWIFDLEGEKGFREREEAMIAALVKKRGIVLATGGGAVLEPVNRTNLADNGTVIYLNSSINRLLSRTRKDKNRPLLQTENPRKKIKELVLQRDPLYREVADHVINTTHHTLWQAVNAIKAKVKSEVKQG